MNISIANDPSLIPYVLVILLSGLEVPVNTGQAFSNKYACDAAIVAMRKYDKTSEYKCLPAPDARCSKKSIIKC